MKRHPLDSETYELATSILAQAKRRGQDPVEALHRAGVLTTPAEDRGLQADALRGVLVFLHSHRVADFLRLKFPQGDLVNTSQQDVYDSIIMWLGEYVKGFEE